MNETLVIFIAIALFNAILILCAVMSNRIFNRSGR
jgi:hypothetical protein